MKILLMAAALAGWMTTVVNGALTIQAEPLFAKHCALCHGKDGTAKTPVARKLGVKDLTVSKILENEIEKQILEGKKKPDGNLAMPPFKDKLTADELKALVSFVKDLRK